MAKLRQHRIRVCRECERTESVRRDNRSDRCKSCAARESGAKGLATIRARRILATCIHCGFRYQISSSAARLARPRYCSRACRSQAVRIARICQTCGEGFEVLRSALSGRTNARGKFCCRRCYEQHLCRTERVSGRGSRWRVHRREAIRKAPFCALCGRLRKLEVHHIIPFRLTHDNTQTNLIPLCKSCHKRTENIFLEVEATAPDWKIAKLALRSSLKERQTVTLMKLRILERKLHERIASRTLAA